MGLALYLLDWPTVVLQCFDAVGWVIWPLKIVSDMTYNMFGGTLNLTLLLFMYAVMCWCCSWLYAGHWSNVSADNLKLCVRDLNRSFHYHHWITSTPKRFYCVTLIYFLFITRLLSVSLRKVSCCYLIIHSSHIIHLFYFRSWIDVQVFLA